MAAQGPTGEQKRLVSLVDRTGFDEYVYPKDSMQTVFQPNAKPYHNFSQETVVWPFAGSPAWGQRITVSLPWPWQADFLNWIALRLKPMSWLTPEAQQRIGPEKGDWSSLLDPANAWIWTTSLGTSAIALAEMEVNGVIVEQFSGDWLNVWNKTAHTISAGAAFDDGVYGSDTRDVSVNNLYPSEDGYIYCYLPFWFTKYVNAAFPLLSCAGPDTVRFHITLRPFSDVVRKLTNPKECKETPCGQSFQLRDYSFPFRKFQTIAIDRAIPVFEAADIVCGVSHIDGPLRSAYIERPHEWMMSPVVETVFNEPLKYTINTGVGGTIRVGLPLTRANGPISQLLFFVRRVAAVTQYNDWNNYSATLTTEIDPVWNPERPLLQQAQLYVGTALWAEGDERWWRASSSILMPGGIRAYGNYIYGYNFAERPADFSPSGSLNASRVDMRLNLTIVPPAGTENVEWTVSVFLIGKNWMRFENGLANQLFMD